MAEPTRNRVDGATSLTKDRHGPLTGLVGAENRGRKACRGRIWRPKHRDQFTIRFRIQHLRQAIPTQTITNKTGCETFVQPLVFETDGRKSKRNPNCDAASAGSASACAGPFACQASRQGRRQRRNLHAHCLGMFHAGLFGTLRLWSWHHPKSKGSVTSKEAPSSRRSRARLEPNAERRLARAIFACNGRGCLLAVCRSRAAEPVQPGKNGGGTAGRGLEHHGGRAHQAH